MLAWVCGFHCEICYRELKQGAIGHSLPAGHTSLDSDYVIGSKPHSKKAKILLLLGQFGETHIASVVVDHLSSVWEDADIDRE